MKKILFLEKVLVFSTKKNERSQQFQDSGISQLGGYLKRGLIFSHNNGFLLSLCLLLVITQA